MTGPAIRLGPPDPAAFAPYGVIMRPPEAAGTRRLFGDALTDRPEGAAPALHVNAVPHSMLPLTVARMERHPFAAQCFVPLDVTRYVVLVMPEASDGGPDAARAMGFVLPGTRGVIFHPGTWHLGATVLDRQGSFAVLMWRGGPAADDEIRVIAPLTLLDGD